MTEADTQAGGNADLEASKQTGTSPPTSPGVARTSQEVKVFSFIKEGSTAATFSWENLAFSVSVGKGARKDILQNITGELRPGELTCILGPSGSGKTSMLNILAGRVRPGGKNGAQIDGVLKMNSQPIVPSDNQQIFGYVMQDDALLGTMTPREVLHFAAHLKLSAVENSAKTALVDDLLQSLGLTKCADTMVGNELIKGISGGERKRTAVGAELITNPQLTFLDEPTSGLDTAAAFNVISVLKQLTMLQQSVLCTIHQPSSEIFHLFDRAVFLMAGKVVFHGTPDKIRDHFSTLNYVCPVDYNPADFVMFTIQGADETDATKIVNAWSGSTLVRQFSPATGEKVDIPKAPKRKGFFVELIALGQREVKNTIRDKGTLGARFGSTIFLTLIYSLVFFRIGSTDQGESVFVDRDAYDLQSHAGAVTMLGISSMFGTAQPMLLTFCSERPVFLRESAGNMYGTVAYFLSKAVVEIPLIFMVNLVQWLIAYWLMGMNGNFMVFVASSTLIGAAASSTALLAACSVKDAKQAVEAAPGLFVPQILFAGFFVKIEMIPPFMRWIQYICGLKWGMNIALINEFDDLPCEPNQPCGKKIILELNDIEVDNLPLYYGVLIGMFLLFRLLAMFVLARKAKALYN